MAEGNGTNGISDKFLKRAEEEIETMLEKKKLSQQERAQYTLFRAILDFMADTRKRVGQIERDTWMLRWINENPRKALFLLGLWLAFSSMFYVSGWRRPILQMLGVPPEFIP